MKQFSKIGETRNAASKLRLCFEFVASEDPSADLHDAGLLVSQGVSGWHGAQSKQWQGRAYIESDLREDLEAAQAKLIEKGWSKKAEPGDVTVYTDPLEARRSATGPSIVLISPTDGDGMSVLGLDVDGKEISLAEARIDSSIFDRIVKLTENGALVISNPEKYGCKRRKA